MIITATNSNGQLTTATSAIPVVLQNGAATDRGGSNAGAIAGGVVGGVAALAFIITIIWFLRKRGYFGRSDEDQFTDDMWAPGRHPADDADPVGGAVAGAGEINPQHYEGVDAEMSEQGHVRPLSTQWHPSQAYYEGQPYSGGDHQQYDREVMSSGQTYPESGGGIGRLGSQNSHHTNTSRGMRTSYYGNEGQNILPTAAYPDSFPSESQHPPQHYSPTSPQAPLAYGQPRRNNTIGSISDYGHYGSEGCQTEATTGSTTQHSSSGPNFEDLPALPNTYRLSLGAGVGQALKTKEERPDLQTLHHSTGSSSSSGKSNPSVHTMLSKSTANTSLPPSPSGQSKEEPIMFAERGMEMGGINKMLDRRESTESLIMPSQFLGARVVNQSTPREERSFDWGDFEG